MTEVARPAGPRPRRRLSTQIAIVTTLVAVITALLSFFVSAGLIRSTAQRQARTTLDHYATLLADGLSSRTTGTTAERLRAAVPGIHALDQVTRVTPLWVHPGGRVDAVPSDAGLPSSARFSAALAPHDRAAAAAGQPFDSTLRVGRHGYFVAGRPLPSGDGSIVLVQAQTSASQITSPLRSRIIIALLAGLGVAAIAGILMARRIARPLKLAADEARRMSHGRRDVRLAPEGPLEVVEVSESLNSLASALAESETRERDFFASVSHELRTPLTAIVGYAEALADGVVPPEGTADVGATVLAEATRLKRLAGDLLDLARIGMADFPIEITDVDLADVVRTAADVWHARCAKDGVELRVELPPFPLRIRSDAGRVRQILDGLAENALRVTPRGAPIVLAARPSSPDVAGAVLEVRDGGPGLTEDDVRVAFDRFALHDRYRGERKVGAGLGLALIAGLAARLGGRAAAGRAPEGGARFTVTLPPATPASSSPSSPSSPSAASAPYSASSSAGPASPPTAREAMPGADSHRRFTSP